MTLPLERHWKNVGWALGVETFWGISLSLISVVAIVPVFLSHLGASNTVLGALPARRKNYVANFPVLSESHSAIAQLLDRDRGAPQPETGRDRRE